jgi:hypothetical protein
MKKLLILLAVLCSGVLWVQADETYKKVTSADDVVVGGKYLLVYTCTYTYNGGGTVTWALGSQNTNNRAAVEVSISDDQVTIADDATSKPQPITLVASGDTTYPYMLQVEDAANGDTQYLYNPNSSKNYANVTTDTSKSGVKCSIAINGSTYAATITANIQKSSTAYQLQCYYQGGSKALPSDNVFSYYLGKQNNATFYKLQEEVVVDENTCAKPTFSLKSGSVIDLNNQGDGIELSNTDGSTIKYTITKDDVAGEEMTYSDPIKFDAVGTYTITAHSEAEGKTNSSEETAKYTVKVSSVANIAEWLQLASTDDEVTISNPVTVTCYVPRTSGSYAGLYVKDDSGYLFIYGTKTQLGNGSYTAGKKLSIKGKYTTYNNMVEMVSFTLTDVTGDDEVTAPEPEAIAYADLTAANAARFVSMKHLTYSSSAKFTDEEGNTFGMGTLYYAKAGMSTDQVYNVVGVVYVDDDEVVLAPTEAPTLLPDKVTCNNYTVSDEGAIELYFKHPIKFVSKYASKMKFKLGDAEEETLDVTNTTDYSLEYTPNTEAEEVLLTVTPVASDGDEWSARATTFTLKLSKAPSPETPVVISNGDAVDGAYNIYRFTSVELTSTNAVSLGIKIGEDGEETKVALADEKFTYTPNFDNDEWPTSFSLFVTPYDDVNEAYDVTEIKFNVVDRPAAVVTISPESGKVAYNTEVTLTGDDNTVEIHYTIGSGEEQTYSEKSPIKLREETTITAWGINADKKAGEKVSATYTVEQPDTYELVESLSDLKNGWQYVLVGGTSSSYAVMTGSLTSGYYNGSSLSNFKLGDQIINADATFTPITISKVIEEGETAHYTLYDINAEKYIAVESYDTSSSVKLTNTDNADEADTKGNKLAQFSISIAASGSAATIQNGNKIAFNSDYTRFKTYASGQKSVYLYRLVDTRTAVTLTWKQDDAEVTAIEHTLGEDFTAPTLTVDPEEVSSKIVYSSSDESVASISESGELEIKAAGTTTITAAISNDATYQDASASYTLTVSLPSVGEISVSYPEYFEAKPDSDINPDIAVMAGTELTFTSEKATSLTITIEDYTDEVTQPEATTEDGKFTWKVPVSLNQNIVVTASAENHQSATSTYLVYSDTDNAPATPEYDYSQDEKYGFILTNSGVLMIKISAIGGSQSRRGVKYGVQDWTAAENQTFEFYNSDFDFDNGVTSYMVQAKSVTPTSESDVLTLEIQSNTLVAGIEGVAADSQEAPVEYYNLQGVRVSNPGTGLYIRRQGTKVEKVAIR